MYVKPLMALIDANKRPKPEEAEGSVTDENINQFIHEISEQIRDGYVPKINEDDCTYYVSPIISLPQT